MKRLFCVLHIFLVFIFFGCKGSKVLRPMEVAVEEPFVPSVIDSEMVKTANFALEGKALSWVDSIYGGMSLEEKVGQLFMTTAYSNKDSSHVFRVDKLVKDQKIGGVIFFQGGPFRQAKLTNRYQSKAKIPLFIGIDAEWGLSMRLDSTYKYPYNMTLGAVQDMALLEQMGKSMGQECKRLGVHFNFAPVLDINTNPKNPIIGFRSFGEDRYFVANRASALMKGQQSVGVFATGKHFPGHGDTEVDSHKSLPVVNFGKERMQHVELYPYRKLFHDGLSSVMVGHLNLPKIESDLQRPSSLSKEVISKWLKDEMDFNGLIFTDALNMRGVSNFRKAGKLELEAFMAGNDILLCSDNVLSGIETIKQACLDSIVSEKRLAESVKKILLFKYKSGLNNYKPIDLRNLNKDLNNAEKDALQYQLYQKAITVLKNQDVVLPIKNLDKNKIAYLKLGEDNNEVFLKTLKKYAEISVFKESRLDTLQSKLKGFDVVIIGIHKSDKAFKKETLTDAEVNLVQSIAKEKNVILDVFAKPYLLQYFPDFSDIKGLMVSYQNNEFSQNVSAQIIFGAIESAGKLPVSVGNKFFVNDGLKTEKLPVLGFDNPINLGVNPEKLEEIDKLVNKSIDQKVFPGAQIVLAKKGKVFYEKSFGFQTYEKKKLIQNETLFDLASVSKIIGTLPNVMQAYDSNEINLESNLGDMVSYFRYTDKSKIIFKDLMTHSAGFMAWHPFYKNTLDINKRPKSLYYNKFRTVNFDKQVADSLFINSSYNDTIMQFIAKSKLSLKKEYKYSDFTFMILKTFLEERTKSTLDSIAKRCFFDKLGMNNTLYNPLGKFLKEEIAPTEIDNYFRHQEVRGYVHDMAAAMQGGVAGHAGLFSNAIDVCKMMQMYLQKGIYGNQTFFSSKTFDDFNTCYYCGQGNRRGLGFDKPQLSGNSPVCTCVSKKSFGHTGFTGTMAWADPENDLVFVFLSNRTYPDANINLLAERKIREKIQEIVYKAIKN